MRSIHAYLFLSATLALAPLLNLARGRVQDPEKPQDAPVRPRGLGGFLEEERERIIESLEGVWMLVRYDPPNAMFDARNVQGVLMFRDGYLSINLMALQFAGELFGDDRQLFVQGGAHRYRIDDFGRLQTSTIMSYHNFAAENDLEAEPSGSSREYMVKLDEEGDTLRLTKSDGAVLSCIRLKDTEFPEGSAEALENGRADLGAND